MTEHRLNRHVPLVLEARRQLLSLLGHGLAASPHLRAGSLRHGIGSDQVTLGLAPCQFSSLGEAGTEQHTHR